MQLHFLLLASKKNRIKKTRNTTIADRTIQTVLPLKEKMPINEITIDAVAITI